LIEAVRLMHSQSIYHRDLKPGNILFNEKLVPKIVDFGLANSIDRKAGTRAFYAPE